MKFTGFTILGLFICIQAINAQPQRRANIWHFGNREGMDFSCGTPVKVTGTKITTVEGATGICDENGRLLLYVNPGGGRRGNTQVGGGIWNAGRELIHDMLNAEGGGYSSSQGGIMLPDPASGSRYYLFTVDELESIGSPLREHRGLSYFVIDMNLGGGLGAVVQSNIPVLRPAVECVTAARHGSAPGYWVLTVDFDSRDLAAVAVTPAGVSAPIFQPRPIDTAPLVIKMSPDGQFLFDGVGLFRFNAADASIQFITALSGLSEYSFSFSPSSRYLYGATLTMRSIVRFDMLAPDIEASREFIMPLGDYSMRYMQIGPDGNLYFNTANFLRSFNRVDVSVIRCPDSPEPQVIFDLLPFAVDPSAGTFAGLVNFADFWFDNLLDEIAVDTVEKRLCSGSELLLEADCTGADYRWSTGAGSRQISVPAPGEYQVSVTTGCFTVIETFRVVPGELPAVAIAHEPFDDFCAALPITLSATPAGADTLYWSNAETGTSIVIERGGRYTVTVENTCGTATATLDFPEKECCRIYVPSAFSPNDDGVNDVFGIGVFQCPFAEFQLQIFSRWGELIFDIRDPGGTWNGKSGSKDRPAGVYAWTITYGLSNDPQQRKRVERGDLTLLR